MTVAGTVSEYVLPSTVGDFESLVAGHDGNLYAATVTCPSPCTSGSAGIPPTSTTLAKISTSGTATVFGSVPDEAVGLVYGPDGNLWTFGYYSGNVYAVATGGPIVHTYPTTNNAAYSNVAPSYVTTFGLGPDGDYWYDVLYQSQPNASDISKITPSGTAVYSFVQDPLYGVHDELPTALTAGPDGNEWYLDTDASVIVRVTPDGKTTVFPTLTPNAFGNGENSGMVDGPDGNLWFTENAANKIARITPVGVVSEFAVPTANADIGESITVGPDKNIYFGETGKIGVVVLSGS